MELHTEIKLALIIVSLVVGQLQLEEREHLLVG